MNLLDWFNRVRLGGVTMRYHAWRNARQQTVADHSWGVAVIILKLHPSPSRDLLAAALFHDVAEGDTGDAPAQAKWRWPELKAAHDAAEADINKELGLLPLLTSSEEHWLKWADLCELMLHNIEEYKMGNRYARIVLERAWEPFAKLNPPNGAAKTLCGEISVQYINIQNEVCLHAKV